MGTYVRSSVGRQVRRQVRPGAKPAARFTVRQSRPSRAYAIRIRWGAVRLAFVALAVGLILGLLVPRLLAAAGGSAAPKKHVVVAGESLWELAGRYEDGGDRRRFVYEAIRLNGLGSPAVYPGQQLVLP